VFEGRLRHAQAQKEGTCTEVCQEREMDRSTRCRWSIVPGDDAYVVAADSETAKNVLDAAQSTKRFLFNMYIDLMGVENKGVQFIIDPQQVQRTRGINRNICEELPNSNTLDESFISCTTTLSDFPTSVAVHRVLPSCRHTRAKLVWFGEVDQG
jgi:hypothetical protein